MSMNDSMSGYKKYKNKEGFTNQTPVCKIFCVNVIP